MQRGWRIRWRGVSAARQVTIQAFTSTFRRGCISTSRTVVISFIAFWVRHAAWHFAASRFALLRRRREQNFLVWLQFHIPVKLNHLWPYLMTDYNHSPLVYDSFCKKASVCLTLTQFYINYCMTCGSYVINNILQYFETFLWLLLFKIFMIKKKITVHFAKSRFLYHNLLNSILDFSINQWTSLDKKHFIL